MKQYIVTGMTCAACQSRVEKAVSKTDSDCGMFAKGTHERQFAYDAHTVLVF